MEFLASGTGASLWATFLLAVILFAAHRMGGLTLVFCGIKTAELSGAEETLFSIGCGLLLLSLGVLFIGLTGLLTRFCTGMLVILFFLLPSMFKNTGGFDFSYLKKVSSGKYDKLFFVLAVAPLFLSWIQALTPPIGNDALAYHLYHAEEFVLHHRVFYVPYSRESLWPYQTEMLFALGLALQGTVLAQLSHWLFYPLTALAIYNFADRHLGRHIAQISALIFLFTPAAFAQSGHAYVDLSLAFFIFLAVYAFSLKKKLGDRTTVLLSGLFCGGALGTKYLGLGCFLVLGAIWLWHLRRHLKLWFCFIGSALAISAVWYLRSWWVIGNPFYPFFPKFFHGHGYEFDIGAGVGMGKGPLSVLLFLWNLTIHPGNFGGELMGPIYLMFVPLALGWLRNARRMMLEIVIFVVLFFLFLFFQSQQARFYLTLVPFLSVAAALVIHSFLKKASWPGRFVAGLLIGIIFIHTGIFVYRVRDAWGVDFTGVSAEQYLLKHERSFRGYMFLKERIKLGERIYVDESRHFYNPIKDATFNEIALVKELEKKKITLCQYFLSEKFDYIWLMDIGNMKCLEALVHAGYKIIFEYEFQEGTAKFHNTILKRPARDESSENYFL